LLLLWRQGTQHCCQRIGLHGIPSEHLAAFGKAAGIERQRQGDQRAVAALFFGMTEGGVSVVLGAALKVGIGQIVKRDKPWRAKCLICFM
jgi:hypothetical protein